MEEIIKTKYIKVESELSLNGQLEEAGAVLRHGGTVAFPTETVYGLGANALSEEAIAKIFAAKGRPQDNPLIIHISKLEQLKQLVKSIPPVAEKIMRHFWPGPLTLVFSKSKQVPRAVTAGLDTVAVRLPDHEVALALIDEAGVPVAAPSANISGKPSPTTALHVKEDLSGKIDVIVDGGVAGVGLESTVLDVTGPVPMILRPGGITVEMIAEVTSGLVEIDPAIKGEIRQEGLTPRSPGMKYAHYSPEGQVILVQGDEADKIVAKVKVLVEEGQAKGKKVAVLATDETSALYQKLLSGKYFLLQMGSRSDLAQVSQRLYDSLRRCDQIGADLIFTETFTRTGLGMALMNRLDKAAGYQLVHAD